MSATETYRVGVVVERRTASSPWAEHIWLPVGVLASAPELPDWTSLGVQPGHERFFAGGFDLELHRTDTPTYRDNLATGAPHMWIACRAGPGEIPIEIVRVTADPAEGEAFTEAGDDIVEQVPMPPELVAEHHVERVFIKRRRDGARRLEEDEE